MKNKDITSAIIGSAFFAIPYLGLSITLAPALVIGAAAFGASELVLSGINTRKNLSEIHEVVGKIISTAEESPKKAKKLDNFFDYYLPVLIKIVNRYDEVENKRLKSIEGKEFMAKADKMIADTKKAFNSLLSSLWESDIIDADADMKVYNLMLKADGIAGDNLIMKGSDEDEK